jgi:peptide/nickel transport system permease protein
VLTKYPLRMSLNFFISDIGSILPASSRGRDHRHRAVAGNHRPDADPGAASQDMYLAGSFLMFLALLTVIGVLISDIALAMLDPRIRLQGGSDEMTLRPAPAGARRSKHYVSTRPSIPIPVER